jgi:GH43 family beta-xylosidase
MKILFYVPTILAILLVSLPCFAQTFRNPGRAAADPMILRKTTGEVVAVDGRYFLFYTGGGPNEYTFVARSTADFVEWKEEGVVFDGKDTWARSAYWAPEAYEIAGKYYLFFSAQNSDLPWTQEEHFNIGVAVADRPAGPYKLLVDRPIFEPGYPIIDANLFIDTDGTPYMTYSRCCYQHSVASELADLAKRNGWFETIEESWVYGVQLTPDFTRIVGEPVLLLHPPVALDDAQAEWESRSVTSREVNRRWTEGSTLFKHRDTYYLMYSANNFAGDHYATGYATSDKPLGPYKKAANNPVLEKNTPSGGTVRGTGHNNIFIMPDGTMYCVYHGRTRGNERRLFIDRMEIDNEGVLRVHGPTTIPQASPIAPQVTDQLVFEGRADPWIIKDGNRYIWCFTDNDRGINLFETDSPRQLGTKHEIWKAPETGPYSKEVWAPELHRFEDRWYVYFAASDGNNETHRTYVLMSKTEDPFGEYDLIGPLPTCGTGNEGDDGCWAIDMTVLEHKGKLYAIWSGWKTKEDIQYQYIAPMSDPATISGPRVMMCRNDDYLWERTEETPESRGLHEGAQILKRGNRTFVIYSCGASWLPTYKLGLLELVGDDPLNPEHWKKHPEPVFQAANTPGGRAFGVGHACFLLDEPEPLIIYHTKRYSRPGWNRDVYIRTFQFDENDFPIFGVRE